MCHLCLQHAADQQARQEEVNAAALEEVEDRPVWDLPEILDQLDLYGLTIPGDVIKYAFPENADFFANSSASGGEAEGFSSLNPLQQAQARLVYSLWDDLIAPSVQEINDPFGANITISNTSTGITFAHAQVGGGAAWLGSMHEILQKPILGEWGFLTFLHEIGHSFGLTHSHTHALDSHMFSVMTVRYALETGADTVGADNKLYFPQTPMLHDILAVQSKYGADMTTRTGDTVYGFNSNTNSPIFDFEQNANPVIAIWDAGGIDTLDLSGFAPDAGNKGSVINLAPGSFSDTASMAKNISIAYGAWIENAIGGLGNDIITGNKLANTLIGNAGNDVLNGADGDDYLDGGSGRDRLLGGVGNDILVYDVYDGAGGLDGGSGTDVLLIKGGRLPTFDLASRNIERADHVQTDTSGRAPWATKTDHYDQSWQRFGQDGTSDDGTSWKTVWDIHNAKSWLTHTNHYDQQGEMVEQTGELNNGQSWHHIWSLDQSEGWSRATTQRDLADTTWWAEATSYFNENGQIMRQAGAKDNGEGWEHTYDVDDTESWTRQSSTYDDQGRAFLLSGEADTGETWKAHFDVGEDYWWKKHLNTYNASGQKMSQAGEKDNGQTWLHTWDVEGKQAWARETVSEDKSNINWWGEHTLYFNDVGEIYRQTGVKDNTDTWEHIWDLAGTESWHRQTTKVDVQDAHDWAQQIQTFDIDGNLLSTSYVIEIA